MFFKKPRNTPEFYQKFCLDLQFFDQVRKTPQGIVLESHTGLKSAVIMNGEDIDYAYARRHQLTRNIYGSFKKHILNLLVDAKLLRDGKPQRRTIIEPLPTHVNEVGQVQPASVAPVVTPEIVELGAEDRASDFATLGGPRRLLGAERTTRRPRGFALTRG